MLGRHLPQPWVLVRIPPLGGEDIDDLDELVDRAVHANPLAGDLDLGLVDEPVIDRGVQARPRGVDRQEGTSLYQRNTVVDGEAGLGQQFLYVSVGQAIRQVDPPTPGSPRLLMTR